MRGGRAFDIDFAPASWRGWRISLAALGMLAAGLVAALTAGGVVAPRLRALQSQQSTLARVEATRAEAMPGRPAVRNDRGRPADAAAFAEVQRLAADLHRPWPQLFDAVEEASNNRVRITQIGIDNRFNGVTIQVEARALGDVVRYAQSLAAAGTPIASAQLASHEWIGTAVRVVAARVTVTLDGRARPPSVDRASTAQRGPAPQLAVRAEH